MPDEIGGTRPPAPKPVTTSTTITPTKAWGWAKDLAVLAIIPLVGWVVKLEVGNAQRDLRLEQLVANLDRVEDRVEENEDIDNGVQANALKLVQLEGKLDTANGRLNEIKDLLRR
jgi:hypothetical protein